MKGFCSPGVGVGVGSPGDGETVGLGLMVGETVGETLGWGSGLVWLKSQEMFPGGSLWPAVHAYSCSVRNHRHMIAVVRA